MQITIFFVARSDWKQTSRVISKHLAKGDKVILRYGEWEEGKVASLVARVRPPKGKKIEEHWRNDDQGAFCSLVLQ